MKKAFAWKKIITSVLLSIFIIGIVVPASTAFAGNWPAGGPTLTGYGSDLFDNVNSGIKSMSVVSTDFKPPADPNKFDSKDTTIGASELTIQANLIFTNKWTDIKNGWRHVFSDGNADFSYYGPSKDTASFVATLEDTNGNIFGQPIILPQEHSTSSADDALIAQKMPTSSFYKYFTDNSTDSNGKPKNDSNATNQSETVKTIVQTGHLAPGQQVYMGLWYCPEQDPSVYTYKQGTYSIVVSDDTDAKNNPKDVKKLWNSASPTAGIKCASWSNTKTTKVVEGYYYRIGKPIPYTIPTTNAQAAIDQNATDMTQAVAAAGASVAASGNDVLPSCGLTWMSSGTFMGCIALFFYYVLFRGAAFFAYLMGNIFDFFLGYSISSTAYLQPFVASAWTTVRDIANIFFIILLIYAGLSTIFGGKDLKKLVSAIIVNAILINFSLLLTRGVIDISNIVARVFYAQISVQGNNAGTVGSSGAANNGNSDSGYKGVSAIVVQSFDPQRVFNNALSGTDEASKAQATKDQVSAQTNGGAATFGTAKDLSQIKKDSPEEYAGYFTLVVLICTFIAFGTGLIFWSIGFIFIGRVIGLYVAMIFSPVAFMSREIPFLSKLDSLHWTKWLGELMNYAILAPVTVIYFYLVIKIMQTPFYTSHLDGTNHTFTYTVLWIAIPLLIVKGLLDKGKVIITSFAGDFGKQAQAMMSKAAGFVGGAALTVGTMGAASGIAAAGSRLSGVAGRSIGKSRLGQWASSNADNNYFARKANNALNKSQTASFDFRNNSTIMSGLSKVGGSVGMNYNDKFAEKVGFGKKDFEGGFKGMKERKEKQNKEKIEKSSTFDYLDDVGAKMAWEKHQGRKAEKEAIAAFTKEQDEQYKTAEATKKNATDQKKQAEAAIKEIKTGLNAGLYSKEEKAQKMQLLETHNTKLSELVSTIKEQNKVQASRIDANTLKIKGGKQSLSDEEEKIFKDKVKTLFEKKQKDDVEKYGKIGSVKDFSAAMKNDYAEDMKQNSLYFKPDGEKRTWSKYLAPAETDAMKKAADSYTRDYGKNKGKNSLEAQLRKLDEKVKKTLVGEDVPDEEYNEKYKDKDKEKKDDFEKIVAKAYSDVQVANAEHKKAEKVFMNIDSPAESDKEAFANASIAKKAAEDKHNDLKNIWDKREALEKKIQDKAKEGGK